MTATGIDAARFRDLLGRFATGVTIVTVQGADGSPLGMTVNSLTAVSLDPPLILICIDHGAELHDLLHSTNEFAVNILAGDQEALSRRFADRVERRFAGVGHRASPGGLTILDGVIAYLECERYAEYPGGDHSIILGRVIGGDVEHGTPLIFYRGGYTSLDRP